MKWMKLATVLATTLAFGRAYAFHDGGVAYCDGCHTMHNSSGNAKMTANALAQFQGNNFLLKGSDNSSTCLNCHGTPTAKPGGYHIYTSDVAAGGAPVNFTPGGDFGWLKISTTGTGSRGQTVTNLGERHGHNIVAADFGLIADAKLAKAPGGDYPAANLSCASCHDPHSRSRVVDTNGTIAVTAFGSATLPIAGSGSYGDAPTATEAVGVYRLLASRNYSQMSVTGYTAFNADPPVAVAPATYNQSEGTAEVRVAYGQGMSEWCANCHRAIHNGNVNGANSALIHPAGNTAVLSAKANNLAGDASGTTIAAIYNAYKKSGDLTGAQASAYTSLVPYEEGTGVIATLKSHSDNTGAQTAGPSTGTENVMCLSCHRAHATGFSSMTRWTNATEYLTVAGEWPGTDAVDAEAKYADFNFGMNKAQYQAAMYQRSAGGYATFQRSLCNKCHAKD
jgi:hypothetical protein